MLCLSASESEALLCYRTEDGEEVEGVLSNPWSNLEVGQKVRLKYYPKHKTSARLIG